MKYKRLNSDELLALEKDFILFLASAHITAVEWDKMKVNNPKKVDELIAVFSDVVYEKVLGKVKYLEHRAPKSLYVFSFTSDKIVLVGLHVNMDSLLDITATDVFLNWNEKNHSEVKIFKTEKSYSKEPTVEIFEMLQNGCKIADERLFNLLNGMV